MGGGIGGPIARDQLWFFGAYRTLDKSVYQAGNYYNMRQGTLFYEPDLSRPAYNRDYSTDYSLRLTWQAAAKHKIVMSHDQHPSCQCVFALLEQVNPILAPEATAEHHYDPQFLSVATYTYPVTNRLLIEVDASASAYHRKQKRVPEVGPNDISVTDTGLNLRYGSRSVQGGIPGYQVLNDDRLHERFGVSYVTGSHNFKIGVDLNQIRQGRKEYTDTNLVNQNRTYIFRNRQPVSVTIYASPNGPYSESSENAIYSQDQWTFRRLTLNLGLRYNVFDAFIPAQHLAAGPFVPERDFPEVTRSPHWQNLSPRLGAAYNLFGTGTTAVKVALGRYPGRNPGVAVNIPSNNQASSTTRSWTDQNGNFIPDCDLRNPLTNGECGQWSDLTFGQVRTPNTRRSADAREGFNLQNYNWQAQVSVQQQLRSNLGLNVGYFRTWYGGFLAVDNQLLTPADYDSFCITTPVDSRLPGGGGQRLCGIYDISPQKFGQVDNVITQSSHYGNQVEIFNGIDVTLNGRFARGGQVQGGLSTGHTLTDNCLVVDSPSTMTAGIPMGNNLTIPTQDTRPGFCRINTPWSGSTQVKLSVVYPLPWDLQASALYQNAPGFPITASYVASNAEIKASLGRNLAACPSQTAATCNQTVTIDLIPPNTLYDERIQEIDFRFSKIFRMPHAKLQANVDVYNAFNASTILNENTRYTVQNNQWLNAIQVMGGRLLKFGAQLTF